jgi:thiamine pyrophosphate-dependent acetolactate synthase large subunit-like protein
MSPVNGGALVVASLAAHGVDVVFGIPGSHNLEIYRALHGSGIRHITPRHEQGAGYAADGYARTTGRPGVAIVTTGPALLNIAAAVGQAYSDSIPLLVISPGMPLGHVRGSGLLHETKDQSAVLAAVAGRSHRVASHTEIGTAIAAAFAEFTVDRPRPIHIEIPLDLLVTECEMTVPGPVVVPPRQPDPALIDDAVHLLSGAGEPLLIVGGGAKSAATSVLALAERLQALVLSTTNGKGTVPDDHPLTITSALHLPAAVTLIDNADVVVAIGTELAPTDFWSGPPQYRGRLIRIDVDPAQLFRNARPDVGIVGDARCSVDMLLGALPAVPSNDRANRARAAVAAQAHAEGARWLPWLAAIDAVLTPDAIVVADNAMSCYYGAIANLPVRRPGGFCFPTGYGTLGYALPAALGAKVGNPTAPVVALSGDGGLMFSVQELATAAAERVPLPVVVFDNGGYGEIRAEMRDAGIEPMAVDLPVPDFVDLARALGGHGVAVECPATLTSELTSALRRPGPTVLVVKEMP